MKLIVYSLPKNAYGTQEMTQRTPSEALVLTYLRLRRSEGKSGATREQMVRDTGVSDRTLDRTLTKLKQEGVIEKHVIWEALPFSLAE